jgi:glycosyltransferase involved in cell wall biosynthesis
MPLLSIITPVNFHAADHLAAAFASIRAQHLPADWEWEWLVHIDGGDAPAWLLATDDDRIRLSADPRNHGPATIRNMLLSRALGSHVKVLDADDQLARSALARDLAVIDRFDHITWVTSRARDLREDGALVEFANGPTPGLVARGSVFHYWQTHGFRLPVHPATLFAHRETVVALGGWTAVATSEDTGLVLALNCSEPGYFIGECGLTYRKWAKQLTAQDEHLSAQQSQMRAALISRRCEQLLLSVPLGDVRLSVLTPAHVDG